MTDPAEPAPPPALDLKTAAALQAAYAERRRQWAAAVDRPYPGDEDGARDLRPPPGELDAEPDE